eukprot:c22003_g1_i2 orf=290-463(+)
MERSILWCEEEMEESPSRAREVSPSPSSSSSSSAWVAEEGCLYARSRAGAGYGNGYG